MEAMIDPRRFNNSNLKLAHAHALPLPLLLQTFSFSQAPKFLFLVCFPNGKKMRKCGFIWLFLLASSHALVWFWCVELERKTRKVFYRLISLLATKGVKPNSNN